jgi:hypothetical protein
MYTVSRSCLHESRHRRCCCPAFVAIFSMLFKREGAIALSDGDYHKDLHRSVQNIHSNSCFFSLPVQH